MTKETQILPCPFCGADAECRALFGEPKYGIKVMCTNRKCGIGCHGVEKWNRRSTPAIADDVGVDWKGLEKILRGMRARNEQGSLELTNWIADNRTTPQAATDEG